MATRNKKKLAGLNKENYEEHSRSNLAQNSTAPRSQEDSITQVSEETEERVTKKLSQDFSRTESRILGALARLDDFLMNPLLQGHSGVTPETSRNVLSINQGTNEDHSQSDPHPEAGPLTSGWRNSVFRRKYVKPQSMATAKHKFQKIVFNPANQKLVDFLDELQKLAKNAFGISAHAIIEQFIHAKMSPHLKKPINQAHLENGTYEQIVTHLERELELNGLEAPDELQINTVSHNTVKANTDKTKPTCHYSKKPGHYKNQCRLLKKQREQTENNQNNPGNKNSDANTSYPNGNVNNPNNNNRNSNRAERKPKTVYPPCETCGKTNHSTERCYHGANAANRPPPRQRRRERQNQVQERGNQNDSNEINQAAAQNLN